MSILVDYPMEHEFQKSGCCVNSGFVRSNRKRKNEDNFEFDLVTPSKFSRKEVSVDDVMKKDIVWYFDIPPCDRTNLECTLEDGRLVIASRRSDNRIERRCIGLPDFVDPQSICMCFDPESFSDRLLVGFNYVQKYKKHLE